MRKPSYTTFEETLLGGKATEDDKASDNGGYGIISLIEYKTWILSGKAINVVYVGGKTAVRQKRWWDEP